MKLRRITATQVNTQAMLMVMSKQIVLCHLFVINAFFSRILEKCWIIKIGGKYRGFSTLMSSQLYKFPHTLCVHINSKIATTYISSSLLHKDHGLHLLCSNFFQNKNSLLEASLSDFGYSKRK